MKADIRQLSVTQYKDLGVDMSVQGIRKAIRENRIKSLTGVLSAQSIGSQYVLTVDIKQIVKIENK